MEIQVNNHDHSASFSWGHLLRRMWVWFDDPKDTDKVAMITFFSYNDVNISGFKKKEGWTSVIDLSLSLDKLWENIRKKYSRALITEGEKKGIIIKISSEFSKFKKIYKNFRKAKNLPKDRFSLFKQGILFAAYYNDEMIAGHVFVGDGIRMRSWVTASKRFDGKEWKDKRLIGCANRMLIWEAIKYAKENNYKIFDLGGMTLDQDPEHMSLTEFKESFGGRRIKSYYYSKVYSPWLKVASRLKQIVPHSY